MSSAVSTAKSPVRRALLGAALVASVGVAGVGVTTVEHGSSHASVGAMKKVCWYQGWFQEEGVWYQGWFSEPC